MSCLSSALIISGKIGRRCGPVLPDNSISDGAFTCGCVLNRDGSGFGAVAVLPAIMLSKIRCVIVRCDITLPGDRVITIRAARRHNGVVL